MDMGHFFFTQPDPTAYRTDPIQPIVPAHGPTKPIRLTAKLLKESLFNNSSVAQYVMCSFCGNFQSKVILLTFNILGIIIMTSNKWNVLNVVILAKISVVDLLFMI